MLCTCTVVGSRAGTEVHHSSAGFQGLSVVQNYASAHERVPTLSLQVQLVHP